MRKALALAVSTLILISLSACAPAKSENPKLAAFDGIKPECEHYTTGDASAQIKFKLIKDVWPEISFPTPLNTDKIETFVQVEGDGPEFTGNQMIDFDYQIINGGTGDLLQSSSFDGTDNAFQLAAPSNKLLCHTLSGVKEGSLVSILLPWEEVKDTSIVNLGLNEGDSLVLTVRLNKVFLPRANGDAQAPESNFPQVVNAKSGEPGLVIQNWDSPAFTKFAKADLVAGRGEEVKVGQKVTVHYSGWIWSSKKAKFDSSWAKQQPTQFQLSEGNLIPGFIKALVGEKVGSRVIAVLPPDEAYGDKVLQVIPANSTLIFVIDILGVE